MHKRTFGSWLTILLTGSTLLAQGACASNPAKNTALTATPSSASAESEMMPTEVLIAERVSTKRKKGGGSSSIGTDSFDVRTQTAWFYGTRPIVTCFQHVDSFGVDEKAVSAALERSIEAWKAYFTKKQITRNDDATSPSANFKITGKCKGEEDLVIHFGTGPIFGGLTDLKAIQKLNYPAAYVNKSHMSRDMRWSKGYIRIVSHGYYGKENSQAFPNWIKSGTLTSILTHEIGHVLGFVHTPGTVMSSDLVELSLSEKSPAKDAFIDGTNELVTCFDCARNLVLSEKPERVSDFEALGLNPKNPIELTRTNEKWTLSDGSKTVVLQKTSQTTLASVRSLSSNFDAPKNATSDTINVYGFVTREGRNEKQPLVLEFNSGAANGAVILRAAIDGEIREIGRFRER